MVHGKADISLDESIGSTRKTLAAREFESSVQKVVGSPQSAREGISMPPTASCFNTWKCCELQPSVVQLKVAGTLNGTSLIFTYNTKFECHLPFMFDLRNMQQ